MKTIIDFFKYDLQAPLHNHVWSWGAVSTDGKRQALRVWEHDYKKIDGAYWVSVDYVVIPETQESLGAPERRRHVDALRAGFPTAGVIVTAEDPLASPRKIRHTNFDQLIVLTPEFKEIGNDVFAKALCALAMDAKRDPKPRRAGLRATRGLWRTDQAL